MAKLENLFQIDFGRVWKVLKQLNILLTQWLSNSAPSCLPKRNENIMLPKHLYENSSFTHTSPNLELNQLSINSKTIKQIVIGTHNGYHSTTIRTNFYSSNNVDNEQKKSYKSIHDVLFHIWNPVTGNTNICWLKGQQCLPLRGCLAPAGQDASWKYTPCSSFFK